MEAGTIVWIIIIILLTLAYLITYATTLSIAVYQDKDKKKASLVVFGIISAVMFLLSGITFIGFDAPTVAAIMMAISLFSDYIMAFIVGGAEIDGTAWRLALARYLPFTTKTILLSYMTYLAGAMAEATEGKVVYGQSMMRRGREDIDAFRAKRGLDKNPFKRR